MPRGRRHYRVTLSDAYAAHEDTLRYGGLGGVLDRGRIEAAINRPYSGYHRPIASKAAALFEAIIKNHGFVDGNKRTAVTLADLLVKKSGYRLESSTAEENLALALVDLAVSVASGELERDEIADWFKQRLVAQ